MENEGLPKTVDEKMAVIGERYKAPFFVCFCYIFTAVLFIVALVVVNYFVVDDDYAGVGFWFGGFVFSLLFSIIATIRERSNWMEREYKRIYGEMPSTTNPRPDTDNKKDDK